METSITIAILAGFLGHPASSIQLQNPSPASRAGSSRFAVWFFHNVFHCFLPRTQLIVLFLVGDSLGLCLLFWFIILCSFKVFFCFFWDKHTTIFASGISSDNCFLRHYFLRYPCNHLCLWAPLTMCCYFARIRICTYTWTLTRLYFT